MLEHLDHQLACGRSAVALVWNGVCGKCHIRLPYATVAELRCADAVPVCENCGCFLALPEGEARAVNEMRPNPTAGTPRRGRSKTALAGA